MQYYYLYEVPNTETRRFEADGTYDLDCFKREINAEKYRSIDTLGILTPI